MRKIQYKGFTLAELLISSAIFITVSGIIIVALVSAFRLGKKSDVLLTAKQNGDAVISQMVRSIKYAKSLDDPASCVDPIVTDQITITSYADGGQTTYSCPDENSNTIASNGASLVDTASVAVSSCTFSCTQSTLGNPPTITIFFSLGAIATGSGFVESSAEIPFQTSVTMRNYTR